VIEVEGLTKVYGKTKAVDELTFTVAPGIVTGFLGPNGAGKSTTMRMLLGLDRPTSGSARINGKPYADAAVPMREVGALLDARDVHGGRSARAHLLALAQSNNIPRSRVDEVLGLAGITSAAKRRIKGYSLGMAQRLGIAAAMLGDPGVLMFDEPVNGLDPEGIQWIRSFMRERAAEGRTVLVSSHLMSEMAQTADHLVVIGRGRLLADVGTQEFTAGSAGASVRVRSPQAERLAAALRAGGSTVQLVDGELQVTGTTPAAVGDLAAELGIALHALYEHRASLEAAFMEMTRDSVEYRAAGTVPAAEAVR
jgi:ABC-2 type transport system ATP-binding protein